MSWETIEQPHYYAGCEAVWRPWKKLKPDRMCYKAGYRWYRHGVTNHQYPTCQFK